MTEADTNVVYVDCHCHLADKDFDKVILHALL